MCSQGPQRGRGQKDGEKERKEGEGKGKEWGGEGREGGWEEGEAEEAFLPHLIRLRML